MSRRTLYGPDHDTRCPGCGQWVTGAPKAWSAVAPNEGARFGYAMADCCGSAYCRARTVEALKLAVLIGGVSGKLTKLDARDRGILHVECTLTRIRSWWPYELVPTAVRGRQHRRRHSERGALGPLVSVTRRAHGAPMSACKSCGVAVTWARSARGKAMPLQEDENGEWSIDAAGVAWKVGGKPDAIAGALTFAIKLTVKRYSSHFSTCPQAAEWRGSRG